LAVHGLRPDEFDRFVPEVDGLGPADLTAVARRHIHPDRCTVVVVGDRESCAPSLEALGRPVDVITPDF
jgi:predicted Zn-dependent peptidase